MKNIFTIFAVVFLILITACQPIFERNGPDEMITPNNMITEPPRKEPTEVGGDDLQALSDANRAFAWSFYDSLRKTDGNIIFSPFSLSMALSMTLAGAEGETEKAMMNTLQLSMSEGDLHQTFSAITEAIKSSEVATSAIEGDNFELNISNSIWGQEGYGFKDSFLNLLANNYEAGIFNVDFLNDPDVSQQIINKWIENETRGKIKELIPPDAITELTRLILANAIYFKGSWLNAFNDALTQSGDFTTLGEEIISVDMMNSNGNSFNYMRSKNLQAITLPYLSHDFAMTLIIPNQGSFTSVEEGLSSGFIDNWFDEMRYEKVNLMMPRFDFETTIDASEILKSLGMGLAFDPEKANFLGMSEEEGLYITDVLQKATITVDEEGTEAAAATAVIMGIKSMPIENEPITLIIDRPFLFLIQHLPTDSILFMGRVLEP